MARIRRSDGTTKWAPDEEIHKVLTEAEQESQDQRELLKVARWQLAGILEQQNLITWVEAQAWAGGSGLPAVISAAITNSEFPNRVKKKAVLALLGGNEIRPRDREFTIIRNSFNLTKRQAINLFKAALDYDLV